MKLNDRIDASPSIVIASESEAISSMVRKIWGEIASSPPAAHNDIEPICSKSDLALFGGLAHCDCIGGFAVNGVVADRQLRVAHA